MFPKIALGRIICLFLVGVFLTIIRYAPSSLSEFAYIWIAGIQGGLTFGLMAVLMMLVFIHFSRL